MVSWGSESETRCLRLIFPPSFLLSLIGVLFASLFHRDKTHINFTVLTDAQQKDFVAGEF